jgi:transposase-like protein/Zn ribbon nucleic-acid-binding protein
VSGLVAEDRFPQTLFEFSRRFPTEEACETYLAECRWPDGFRCPRCGHDRAWSLPARRLRECAACGYQTSTTAGTVLHRTRTDLRLWFLAAFLMATDKRGLSALSLQRQVGVRRYETAWVMLHKLRRATVNANRTMLRGTVEVDETWIGGEQKGLPGGRNREGRRAALAVFAVELSADRRPVRLRIKLVPDDLGETLVGFVKETVEPGATIITDGWKGYLGLTRAGYRHERIVEGRGRAFRDPVPHVHVAIGNAKAWLIGTHKGVWPRHLAVYLDEFVFRYNRRRNLGLAFRTLLGYGASRGPTTYGTINGAQDLPKIVYTPSKKAKRAAAKRAAATVMPEPPAPDLERSLISSGTTASHRREA